LPSVEKQIEDDYLKKVSNTRHKRGDDADLVEIFYRTTEVRNLTISALNIFLFGVRAGELLGEPCHDTYWDVQGHRASEYFSNCSFRQMEADLLKKE
jgi:hypothetical protein